MSPTNGQKIIYLQFSQPIDGRHTFVSSICSAQGRQYMLLMFEELCSSKQLVKSNFSMRNLTEKK